MSRLSNSRLRLAIGEQAIDASLWRGWLRPAQVAHKRHVRTGTDQWDDPLFDAVQQVLGDLALQAPIDGVALQVQLADSLLQFDVARGEFAGESERQLGILAEASMSELLGDQASRHVLRWQLQRDGRHLLICALPAAILQALQAVAQGRRLRLSRVESAFVAQWNRQMRAGLAEPAVLAMAGERHALIACIERGSIITLRHATLSGLPAEQAAEFDGQIDRLLASLGRPVAAKAMELIDTARAQRSWSHRWSVRAAGEGTA